VFYPPLPERPRIQFLRALSSPADVLPKPGFFAQFVLGPEAQSQAGQINRLGLPINISLGLEGEKYVADTGRGAVLVFDSTDQPVRSISPPEGMKPYDALWYDGSLYVADLKNDAILVFDPESGRPLRRLGKGGDKPGNSISRPTWLSGLMEACR
jgi:hypothetical protein